MTLDFWHIFQHLLFEYLGKRWRIREKGDLLKTRDSQKPREELVVSPSVWKVSASELFPVPDFRSHKLNPLRDQAQCLSVYETFGSQTEVFCLSASKLAGTIEKGFRVYDFTTGKGS